MPPDLMPPLFREQTEALRADIRPIVGAGSMPPSSNEDPEKTPVSDSPDSSFPAPEPSEDIEGSIVTPGKRLVTSPTRSEAIQHPSSAARGNLPAESRYGEPAVHLAVTKGDDGIECRLASERNALLARVRERAEGARGPRRLLLQDLAERLQHRPTLARKEREDVMSPGSIVFVACLALGLLVASIVGLFTGQAFPALAWGAILGVLMGVALALALPALFRRAREARR